MEISFKFESLEELRTFWDQFPKVMGKTTTLPAQANGSQASSSAAPPAASEVKTSSVPVKEETDDDILGGEELVINAAAVRQLATEKAKAGFREDIRKLLDKLKAKSVTDVKEADFKTFYEALNKLA